MDGITCVCEYVCTEEKFSIIDRVPGGGLHEQIAFEERRRTDEGRIVKLFGEVCSK